MTITVQNLVCSRCGPDVWLYSVLWSNISDNPLAIELIEQGKHGLRVLKVLPIEKIKEEVVDRIYHCGNCGTLLHSNPQLFDPTVQIKLYLQDIFLKEMSN